MVDITFKEPRTTAKTVQHLRLELVKYMFQNALDSRFFRISKQTDPPFFSGKSELEELALSTTSNNIGARCCEGGTLQALEQLLTEVKLLSFTHLS